MARAEKAPPHAWAAGVRELPIARGSLAALARRDELRSLGFSLAELERLRRYYRAERREPTDLELAGIAQSWSEHCSYKSSRRFLRRHFAGLARSARVLGTGDAGVLAFAPGWAYALRIESHNHPSAVEPYGGAATGIGGILRDVLAVGGEPIALADPLFFGPLDTPAEDVPAGVKRPGYLYTEVIAGIRDYGNRVGVPTVTGGVYFDPAYLVNPLVNVGCLGILPRSRLLPNRARRAGDRLVLAGGRTGRDGIGGVAFASRELSEESESRSRNAVQLGNPILKEPLMRACIAAYDAGLVRGGKDLGGGGLASASGELVHAAGLGSRLDLDRVPLREEGLEPWEVWISESQERMLFDLAPRDVEAARSIFDDHDVPFTVVGEVTDGPYEQIDWHGRPAGRLRVGFRVDYPPLARPTRWTARARRRPPPVPDTDLAGLVRALVLAPDSLSREPIVRLYDHEVRGGTLVKPLQGAVGHASHGDATVLRPLADRWRGLAVTVAAQPWSCREDPYRGGLATVEEAARNLYAVGARPDAFTNCLNFGNPEDPRVLADLDRAVRGLADGARALGFAVPSGNVSLYNGGLGRAIPPTPVLMATGIVDDLRRTVTSDLKEAGHRLYLVGRSRPELGGSLWARRQGASRLAVPPPDPRALRRRGERLIASMRRGWVRAAHDLSDGGLAVTLCEMAFGGALGFSVDLAATRLDGPGLALAAEGGSRWVVEVPDAYAQRFERALGPGAAVRLGSVTAAGGELTWGGRRRDRIDLDALYAAWSRGPAAA